MCRECKVKAVDLKLVQDQSLIGGFILEAGGKTYDWSLRGRYHRLKKLTPEVKDLSTMNPEEIISILKEEIENYDEISKDQESGRVISVGDGIASVYGIDHAMYGEVVIFENGLKGMVADIRSESIGCILFGKDSGIREGTRVAREHGKQAGIPVWREFYRKSGQCASEPH